MFASRAGMFHASRALTAAKAARYFEAEYRQGDYYTRGNSTAPGRWFGRAATDLGLRGDIRPDDFTALLQGHAPDGTPLVEAQQATGRRRAGWDFACSADKTVSIAALVFEDSRLLDAHDSAVRRALTELETFVQTRAKAGTEVQTTGRMAAALLSVIALLDGAAVTIIEGVANQGRPCPPRGLRPRTPGVFSPPGWDGTKVPPQEGVAVIEVSDALRSLPRSFVTAILGCCHRLA